MSLVFGIDPGPTRSAWFILDIEGAPLHWALEPNDAVRDRCRLIADDTLSWRVVIERIESFGMTVGAETFDTAVWVGRFMECVGPERVTLRSRRAVKLDLCGHVRAKDPDVRQALIDRFGGKDIAIGRKANPGPLYGVHADCWSALALALTYRDSLGLSTTSGVGSD